MPNWCTNSISMDKKEYEKAKHLFINKDGNVDFTILIPESIFCKIDCEESDLGSLSEDYKYKISNILPLIEQEKNINSDNVPESFWEGQHAECRRMQYILMKENDFEGWYNWRLKHWGVKWNASSTDINEDEDLVIIQFDTPWGDPTPFFQELAKHCNFEVECTEESCAFHIDGTACDGEYSYTEDGSEWYEENEEDDE